MLLALIGFFFGFAFLYGFGMLFGEIFDSISDGGCLTSLFAIGIIVLIISMCFML